MRLRARWILPVDAPAIEDGTVVLAGDLIRSVLVGQETSDVENLGNVAVIPGLVNAHTHLEFSDLAAPLAPARPFTQWIAALVAHRRQRVTPVEQIARQGCRESMNRGVTTLGEIATEGWSPEAFAGNETPRATVYREILGLSDEAIAAQLELARQHLLEGGRQSTLRFGLSPHAPYSVHPELFDALIDLAVESNCPVAMHLAETREELELLESGTGPFVEMLRGFGVWREGVFKKGTRPMDYLSRLADVERASVIHGNYLDDDEIAFLAKHPQITVVYCPRTHVYFQHTPHPWRRMLDCGVNVAIGTDGRGSNPDLDVLAELQHLRGIAPVMSPQTLLRLGTQAGAFALGWDDLGSLTPGKRADLAVVDLKGVSSDDPYEAILDPAARVIGTMRDGRWLWRSDRELDSAG